MTPEYDALSGSHAVLIGVSDYESDEFTPIYAARNSVARMRTILTDPILCGWPPDSITVIPNPSSPTDLAIRITELAEQTRGVFLIYYVGHGVLSRRGELCLTVSTTRAARPSITGVSWETMAEALRHSPARVRMAILDCCFAGQAIEALTTRSEAGLADAIHIEGVYTLTATTRNRTAHVPPPDRQWTAATSFTQELTDLVTEGVPGAPPGLTLGMIYPTLLNRLNAKGLPRPNQRGTDTVTDFVFTRNASAATRSTAGFNNPTIPASQRERSEFRQAWRPPAVRRAWESARVTTSLTGHLGMVRSVAFSPDGTTLAVGTGSKIWLWNLSSGHNTAILTGGNRYYGMLGWVVYSVAISPDGKILASGSDDMTLRLWDAATGREIAVLSEGSASVTSVAFAPDGTILADSAGNKIRLWDTTTRLSVATLAGHGALGVINSMAFSPDGTILATGSADKTIRLWDTNSRSNIATLTGHTNMVRSVAFSPDGTTLAAGSDDMTIRLWDAISLRSLASIPGHTGVVNSVAFSPDGTILATGSADKTIRLWDTNSRSNIATLTGHTKSVRSVAFSPDGTTLATGSHDKTVLLWSVPPPSRDHLPGPAAHR